MSFFSQRVSGQSEQELLRSYFTGIRDGKAVAIPRDVLKTKQPEVVLNQLAVYEADTIPLVRSRAYMLLQLVGSGALQPEIRREVVSRLLRAFRNDTGNSGQVLQYLTTFSQNDFSLSSQDSIRTFVGRKSVNFGELMKLAAFLDLQDLKERIRPYTQVRDSQSIRWAALLALARMNDDAAISEIMYRVKKVPVNDDMVYNVFPDLVYTRHPEAIAYMVEVLNSDEKNCLTADAEREVAIPCGYRVMEQLAPVIEKYPLELDESGDVKTKDYVAALKKVREWFAKNTSYKILRDKY